MLIGKRQTEHQAWRAIAIGLFIIMTAAVHADVTTIGCSLQTECTGQELNFGGEFTNNGVRFSDFYVDGVFGEAAVRWVILDDPLNPGFMVMRDGVQPLYRAAGEPVNANDTAFYTIQAPDNRAILRRTLGAVIGEFVDPVTAYVGAETYRLDVGEHDLNATCGTPIDCANSTVTDTVLSDVSGEVRIDDYFLEVVAFIAGDETDPSDAVVELSRATMRFRVEPPHRYYLDIVSGSNWLSSDAEVAGWQTVEFDDSTWVAARAPYPNPSHPTDVMPGTRAEFMWHDPGMSSDGSMGSIHAYFRYPFEIDMPTTLGSVVATIKASVDDDYNLYVNGTLVFENHFGGLSVDTIDIVQYLQDGQNVIAIHAVDGGWDFPYPRGYEWVLVDADISVPRYKQPIHSSSAWLSSDVEQTGWQNVGFDDSSWPPARADYPNPTPPQSLVQDTLARHIWYDPTMSSDGSNGPVEAFFRLNFDLPVNLDVTPIRGLARVNADDDYDLWVNGQLIFRNNDAGSPDNVDVIDFTDALLHGANVIAVRAADGSGDNPHPQSYERFMFDGLIAAGDTGFDNDVDGDSVGNNLDNCITSYNPAQTDTNGDGYGNTCDADLTDDLVVNAQDLGAMRLVFFTNNADADLNVDGKVNAQDLGIMQLLFFGAPGPSATAP